MNAPAKIDKPVEFTLPIKDYNEFYRFYLTEHRSIASRRLHVAGSTLGLYFWSKAIRQRKAKYLAYGLLSGYACAWVGHFFLNTISQRALNNRFIVLFQIGVCCLMLCVVV
jgi:hypothetical protein